MKTQARPYELDEGYQEMLRTLSEGSVHVHFDPYEDIAWDAPELAIDQDDPRWMLSPDARPARRDRLVPGAAAGAPGRDRQGAR